MIYILQIFNKGGKLKLIHSVKDGLVLVDKPELSMHQRWKDRILDDYHELLVSDTGQTTQMIFATHSEPVIGKALQDKGIDYSL